MINDHMQANAQLMQLASRKGVSVPRTLDAQHQQIRSQLRRLSGRNFDQEYMRVMENDHLQTVSLFQSATQQAQDQDVQAFASNTLPKLQGHLQMAQAMRGSNSAQNPHNQR
jgi:putative membrane protein